MVFPGDPDPSGEKLQAHCEFLDAHPHVEYLFIDWSCVPQEYEDRATQKVITRTPEEQSYFDAVLKGGGLNILYLSALVSAVRNAEYGGRFVGHARHAAASSRASDGDAVQHNLLGGNLTCIRVAVCLPGVAPS